MKIAIAIAAITALSGCATYDPHWISKNVQMGNPNNFHTTTISTPQGLYTVRSTTQGNSSTVQVYRVNRR